MTTPVPRDAGPWRTCECGKRAYGSRKRARRAMKGIHPGDSSMQVYACDEHDGNWHYGHPVRWHIDQRDVA